jgi:two-component system, LytTR family, response regulator
VSAPAILRVVVADDERPARALLLDMLADLSGVEVVAEAATGTEAVQAIESQRPDLAFLDLQMPELDGLGVVGMVQPDLLPLVAFVTAHDAYAVKAFELNAVDYLLKPVEPERLRRTLERARSHLSRPDWRARHAAGLREAGAQYEAALGTRYLERIPVRKREEVLLLPVEHLVSVVAEGELLHLTTARKERFTITYRLKDLEARLDPARFIRLSRGALANVRMISRFSPLPGGTYVAVLATGEELAVSRSHSKLLRERLFRL